MNNFNLFEQIELARLSLLRLKKTTPYIFAEYNYMRHCEVEYKKAKKKYKEAKKIWKNYAK